MFVISVIFSLNIAMFQYCYIRIIDCLGMLLRSQTKIPNKLYYARSFCKSVLNNYKECIPAISKFLLLVSFI